MPTIRIKANTLAKLESIRLPGESYDSALRRVFDIPLTPRQFLSLRNIEAKQEQHQPTKEELPCP